MKCVCVYMSVHLLFMGVGWDMVGSCDLCLHVVCSKCYSVEDVKWRG